MSSYTDTDSRSITTSSGSTGFSGSSSASTYSMSSRHRSSRRDSYVGCMKKRGYSRQGFIPVAASVLIFILTMMAFLGGMKPVWIDINLLVVNTTQVTGHNGIEFYSIHVMAICHGKYQPKATDVLAIPAASDCTTGLAESSWDFVKLLRSGAHPGAGIDSPTESALDEMRKSVQAAAYCLLLAVVFSGARMGLSTSNVFYPLDKHKPGPSEPARNWIYINTGLVTFNLLFLMMGAGSGTSAALNAATNLNMWEGGGVGIRALVGQKWLGIIWGAFGAVIAELLYWVNQVMILHDREFCAKGRNYFGKPSGARGRDNHGRGAAHASHEPGMPQNMFPGMIQPQQAQRPVFMGPRP